MIFDKVWRLRWRRDRLQRKFDRLIAKAQKKRDWNERDDLINEVMMERRLYDDEIGSAETALLLHKAEKLGLPSPDWSDESVVEIGYDPSTRYLNRVGRTALRQAIRREQKERLEVVTLIIKDWAAPIIAIIASIVTLILALKVKRN